MVYLFKIIANESIFHAIVYIIATLLRNTKRKTGYKVNI